MPYQLLLIFVALYVSAKAMEMFDLHYLLGAFFALVGLVLVRLISPLSFGISVPRLILQAAILAVTFKFLKDEEDSIGGWLTSFGVGYFMLLVVDSANI